MSFVLERGRLGEAALSLERGFRLHRPPATGALSMQVGDALTGGTRASTATYTEDAADTVLQLAVGDTMTDGTRSSAATYVEDA